MTTRSRFNFETPRRMWALAPLWQAAIPAATLLLPLAAALMVASATGVDAPAAPHARPARDDAMTIVSAAAVRPVPAATPNVEKVAAVLAKRYRVSTQATLDLVYTAYREAHRNGLDPLLILAVMAIESSFNPIAQSEAGAVGLMQIVPRYHEDKLDHANSQSVLDPRTNIEVGTKVLKEYIRRAGNEAAGLQMYNGSADDPATAYANKVMGERDLLRQAIRRAGGNRA